MTLPLSRRQFFGQAPAGAAATLLVAEPPPRAWIIMQADWEFETKIHHAVRSKSYRKPRFGRAPRRSTDIPPPP